MNKTSSFGIKVKMDIGFILLLTVFSVGLYFNTFYNDYCLDDKMLITENKITQKGFAGISEHLSNDFLFGYVGKRSETAAAFWRPIPLISFCIEIGLWGNSHPGYSHLVNVAIFCFLVVMLYFLLSEFILKNKWLSFFSALIFAAHPIHTEVVANIKSRDELFYALFILCSLFLLGMYMYARRKGFLLFSLLSFFFAILSKESAITFLLGVPLFLYFFFDIKSKELLRISVFFIGITILYIFLRNLVIPIGINVEGNEDYMILNHPFLYAGAGEAFFTKVYVFIKYLKLLFIPYPLCFDYSYNQIPYVTASHPWVWISLLLHVSLLLFAIINFRRRSLLSWCIIMYFITMVTVSNFIFETAVIFAERFLFIPSIFLCIAIVYLANKISILLSEKYRLNIIVPLLLLLPCLTAFSIIVVNRNSEWKTTDSLTLADIKKAPQSARVNDGVANYYLILSQSTKADSKKDSLLNLSIKYYSNSLGIFPEFDNSLINIGICYDKLGNTKMAEAYWGDLYKIAPQHPKIRELHSYLSNKYLSKGLLASQAKNYDSSVYYLQKAIEYADFEDSTAAVGWFNLAGTYYLANKYQLSMDALAKVLSIQPGNVNARQGYNACKAILLSAEKNVPAP